MSREKRKNAAQALLEALREFLGSDADVQVTHSDKGPDGVLHVTTPCRTVLQRCYDFLTPRGNLFERFLVMVQHTPA